MSKKKARLHTPWHRLLWRLLKYALPYWKPIVLVGFVALIYAGASQGRLLLLEPFVNVVFAPGDTPAPDGKQPEADADAESNADTTTDAASNTVTDEPNAAGPAKDNESSGFDPLSVSEISDEEAARRVQRLYSIIGLLLLSVLGMAITGVVRDMLINWINRRVMIDVARDVHRHMLDLDVGFFLRTKQGELLTRAREDVSRLVEGVRLMSAETLSQLFILIGACAVAVYASWQLFLVVLVIGPFIGWALAWLANGLRRWFKKQMQTHGELLDAFTSLLAGIRIVKVFQREKLEEQRYADINRRWLRASMKSVKYDVAAWQGMDILYNLLLAVLLFAGGYLLVVDVFGERLTPGKFVMFLLALVAASEPLRRVSRQITMLQYSFTAAERVFEVLDTKPLIQDAPDATEMAPLTDIVRFENVAFTYPTHTPLRSVEEAAKDRAEDEGTAAPAGEAVSGERFELRDVSFDAPRGTVTALVGERGAGKSTILDMLQRFYDPSAGRITFDGVDIRSVTRNSLLSQIAVVTQDTFLFSTTIRDNIAYGREDATQEELEQAARDANILEFIERQPDGWETPVGERGARLSGGERQSVAIARAMVKKAPILVLDEATSNLDAVSEKRVQEALARLMENRTVFVIAHRLSTIRHADIILVIDKGTIAERGTHDELLAQNGLYARLHNTQFGLL